VSGRDLQPIPQRPADVLSLCRSRCQADCEGSLVSRPYVHMTLSVMAAFGVHVETLPLNRFQIDSRQRYQGTDYTIERMRPRPVTSGRPPPSPAAR